MLTKYTGNYSDVLKHWWFDDKQSNKLAQAKQNDSNLPVGEIEHTYWKDLK
jgi:hypothetical protein